MGFDTNKAYAAILAVANGGEIGVPQVCVISVNTQLKGKALEEKIANELSLLSAVCKSGLDKETVVSNVFPYAYGFVAREYQNGNIGRYTFTCAPQAENTQITVYGTDGELRYDSATGEIRIYPQIPDHIGISLKEFMPKVDTFCSKKVSTRQQNCDIIRKKLENLTTLCAVETRKTDEKIACKLSAGS